MKSRRSFLIGFAAGMGTLMGSQYLIYQKLGLSLRMPSLSLEPEHKWFSEIVGRFKPATAMQAVATAYWEKFPEEKDIDQLEDFILPERTWRNFSKEQVENILWAKIREDFRDREVVQLHQWFLSRTEARLLCLSVLTTKGRDT